MLCKHSIGRTITQPLLRLVESLAFEMTKFVCLKHKEQDLCFASFVFSLLLLQRRGWTVKNLDVGLELLIGLKVDQIAEIMFLTPISDNEFSAYRQ